MKTPTKPNPQNQVCWKIRSWLGEEQNIFFWLFAVLVFFTPLIFVGNTQELFEFPKMFFVYLLGSFIIFLFIAAKVWSGGKIKLPGSPILVFVAAYTFSTALSSHIHTSVWGYYTRFNGGLVSILIFFGLYLTAINVFDREDFENLVKIACLSLVPIGFYAFLQHFGAFGNFWKVDPAVRAFSTFGQPNWLAAYTGMLMPLIIGAFLTPNFFEAQKLKILPILLLLFYSVCFSTLWFTYSLSGLLGFLAGVLALFYLSRQGLKEKVKKIAAIAALTILVAITNPGIFEERVNDFYIDLKNFISSAVTVKAQESKNYTISDPGFIRKGLWGGTIDLIFSSPKILITGGGPETYPYEFQKFRPKELNYSSEWDFVFNKPHNYYLELLANTGLLGFIPYILVVLQTLRKKDVIFTPALIVFYVTNIFSWPTVATTLFFWLFLAGLSVENTRAVHQPQKPL